MKTEIKGGPAFAYLEVELAPGESIVAESGAMSSMSADLDMRTFLLGGPVRALLRKLFGGETFFVNRFSNATDGPRRLALVAPTPGELRCVDVALTPTCLQPGALLACTENVDVRLRWAGIVSWLAKEGLFKLEVGGSGRAWYGAYGALIDKQVDGEYLVDTSHLVAYDPSIRLRIQLAGGLFSSLFGGEGLVMRVEGRGRIVVQSRSLGGLAGWLNPKFWL